MRGFYWGPPSKTEKNGNISAWRGLRAAGNAVYSMATYRSQKRNPRATRARIEAALHAGSLAIQFRDLPLKPSCGALIQPTD